MPDSTPMNVDISIVTPTIGRRSLSRAAESIFAQRSVARVQWLVGVDADVYGHAHSMRQDLDVRCPPHVRITWIDPGYSTSVRHGGPHKCAYGGSLRTALSYLAASRHVMYLDDDDWLAETHCADVLQAVEGKAWAFAYSIYADNDRSEPLCVDGLESVGIGQGIYNESFGGFVRPSGLLIDKLAVAHRMHLWCESGPHGDCEDRLIFENLKALPNGCTQRATVFCSIDPRDGMHQARLQYVQQQGKSFQSAVKSESLR
jgi:hypothetical protein